MATNEKGKLTVFNLDIPEENELYNYSKTFNFGRWVKECLLEKMSGHHAKPEIDLEQINIIVDQMVQAKLSEYTLSPKNLKEEDQAIDMEQFF